MQKKSQLNEKTKEFNEKKSALEELKIRFHDVNTFKEFAQQEILSKHIKTHTEDNNKVSDLAYSVIQCGLKFLLNCHWELHYKKIVFKSLHNAKS